MKKYIKIIVLSLVSFIILSAILSIYFSYFHRYKGKNTIDEWSSQEIFSIDNIATVEKQVGKDFVILNLADIQLADIEDYSKRSIIKKEIDYLVSEANPDLITLTGDQTWSNENLISLKLIIKWLDSYEIPYAPIFGNHDFGNEYNSAVASENYCADLYENSKYCLFKKGPTNLGSLGNYAINIVEGDKICKTLYMLNAGYGDKLSDNQIKWVKWVADGIKDYTGGEYTEGMCFTHKPLPQFADAYFAYIRGNANADYQVLVNSSLSGIDDNGFYEVAKDCGIKDFVAGHQHTNSFSINYDDVRFTFALKTGEICYYYDDGETNYNGGTVFVIGDNETVKNIYTKSGDFHINGSRNTFLE